MQPMPLSTILGVGCIVAAATPWWTGALEIALFALGVTKVLLLEHSCRQQSPIDTAEQLVEDAIKASA